MWTVQLAHHPWIASTPVRVDWLDVVVNPDANSMSAFCIWDEKPKNLWLHRGNIEEMFFGSKYVEGVRCKGHRYNQQRASICYVKKCLLCTVLEHFLQYSKFTIIGIGWHRYFGLRIFPSSNQKIVINTNCWTSAPIQPHSTDPVTCFEDLGHLLPEAGRWLTLDVGISS